MPLFVAFPVIFWSQEPSKPWALRAMCGKLNTYNLSNFVFYQPIWLRADLWSRQLEASTLSAVPHFWIQVHILKGKFIKCRIGVLQTTTPAWFQNTLNLERKNLLLRQNWKRNLFCLDSPWFPQTFVFQTISAFLFQHTQQGCLTRSWGPEANTASF